MWPALAAFLSVLLLRESYGSMLHQWSSSTTFTYGFLIAPISAVLLWRDRHALLSIPLRPATLPLVLMVPCGLIWIAGRILSVAFVHHLAAVCLLILSVWTVAGNVATRRMAFPLGYLLFMVPFGEVLVPFLMRLTADFSVLAVQLSGIPVYQDGFLFSLPSGDFEVIKACSGIRFLMATLAAGTIFAYLAFSSALRRALFMLACFVVPVLANLLRTYLVVLVAHLSDLRVATGEDHVLGGTVFFAVVLLAFFLTAARFSDASVGRANATASAGTGNSPAPARGLPQIVGLLAVALILVFTATVPTAVDHRLAAVVSNQPPPRLPTIPGWEGPQAGPAEWRPQFVGAGAELLAGYRSGDHEVGVFLAAYTGLAIADDLVSMTNRAYDPSAWRETRSVVVTTADGGLGAYREILVANRGDHSRRVIWQWYEVVGRTAVGRLNVKLAEAGALLRGSSPGGRSVLISTRYQADPSEGRRVLASFAEAWCKIRDDSATATGVCE